MTISLGRADRSGQGAARRATGGALMMDAELACDGHDLESTFDRGTCRFVLTCSCGFRHTTNLIDEALECWSVHRRLAPRAERFTG